MSIDLSKAIAALNLTNAQAKALDKLDGNADGSISESVFDMAKKAIDDNQNGISYAEQSKKVGTDILHNIISILGGQVNRAANAEETEKTTLKNTESINNKKNVNEKHPEEVDKMKEMAEAALKYYEANQGMKGFSFTGFPKGITNLDIQTQYGYDDSANDTFTIGDNGQQVTRNPDAFTLSIRFKLNGKEYTVSAETTNLEKFPNNAREEFVDSFNEINNTPSKF